MRLVSDLRYELASVEGALLDRTPEIGHVGSDPSLPTLALWNGEIEHGPSESGSMGVEPTWEQSVPDFAPVFTLASKIEHGLPKLGDDQEQKIAREIERRGIDALGWYSSYHVRGIQWGIYISISGLLYLARVAFSHLPVSDETKIKMAFHAILDHELFHFATDYDIGQLEFLQNRAMWAPFKLQLGDKTPPYFLLEEELANAYMLRRCKSGRKQLHAKGKLDALRRFTKHQPEGYRDGWKVTARDWPDRLTNLVEGYAIEWINDHDPDHTLLGNTYDWEAHFPIHPKVDWRYCPILLVNDSQRFGLPEGWLESFVRIEKIEETEAFQKQLKRLSTQVQKAWERTKQKVAQVFTQGCDMKRWPKGGADIYSLRVNDSFRAHLRYDRASECWYAVAIGGHKAMGHG